jgi:hypothetical protein
MKAQQSARHHRQTAMHAVQSGDRGGSWRNPDIKEGRMILMIFGAVQRYGHTTGAGNSILNVQGHSGTNDRIGPRPGTQLAADGLWLPRPYHYRVACSRQSMQKPCRSLCGRGRQARRGARRPARRQGLSADRQPSHGSSRFIEHVRSVSLDPVLMRQDWLSACDFTTKRGSIFLGDYARAADPFGHIGERTVSVQVTNGARLGQVVSAQMGRDR